MGSDKSHFKVSVGSDGQSHKTVSIYHNLFEEKGEPKRYRTEVLPLTNLTARPNRLTQVVTDVMFYVLYVRTFSGYPVTYADWMKELLQLAADVEADGEIYTKAYYYFASYDPPAKMTSRINEVQLLKPHP